MKLETLQGIGLALILAGIVILLVAAVWVLLPSLRGRGKVKGAGVVIIGPFPIIFGTDKRSIKLVLLLSIILVALLIILTLVGHYVK